MVVTAAIQRCGSLVLQAMGGQPTVPHVAQALAAQGRSPDEALPVVWAHQAARARAVTASQAMNVPVRHVPPPVERWVPWATWGMRAAVVGMPVAVALADAWSTGMIPAPSFQWNACFFTGAYILNKGKQFPHPMAAIGRIFTCLGLPMILPYEFVCWMLHSTDSGRGMYNLGAAILCAQAVAFSGPIFSRVSPRDLPTVQKIAYIERLVAPRHAPPQLRDLLTDGTEWSRAVRCVNVLLDANPWYREFLRMDPGVDVAEILGDVKVREDTVLREGVGGEFLPLPYEVLVPRDGEQYARVHELFHVLHFKALVAQMTRPILQQVCAIEAPSPSKFPERVQHYEVVKQFLENTPDSDDPLPPAVRWAGAQLAFQQGKAAVLEAVASRFDTENLRRMDPGSAAWHYAMRKRNYLFTEPFAWWLRYSDHDPDLGYDNHHLMNKIWKQGLFGSLGLKE